MHMLKILKHFYAVTGVRIYVYYSTLSVPAEQLACLIDKYYKRTNNLAQNGFSISACV
jgi:hypothetical protein